jgi:hypothetical protein
VGGSSATATVTLASPAPQGGVTVTLTSVNQQTATSVFGDGSVRLVTGGGTPLSLFQGLIPAGGTSITFTVPTAPVSARATVTLRANAGADSAITTLTVDPPSVQKIALAPPSVIGGQSTTATITLNALAPASAPLSVQLVSSAPEVVVPSSILLQPGKNWVSLVVTTAPVGTNKTAIVSATLGGTTSVPLALKAPAPSALQLVPQSVVGGTAVTGMVVLNGIAGGSGITVPVSASSGDATVPASVTIPPGSDRQSFPISTAVVATTRAVRIDAIGTPATAPGQVQITDGTSNTIQLSENPIARSALLTLTPQVQPASTSPKLSSISAQPSPVVGGASLNLVLGLTQLVFSPESPTTFLPVQLSTDHPELVQLPPVVQVSSQVSSATLAVPTLATAVDRLVTIKAARDTVVLTTTVLVTKPPPTIASFAIRPTTVKGGTNIIAQLLLGASIASPVTVALASDHPELIKLPSSVSVAPGQMPKSITCSTSVVSTATTVVITATVGSEVTAVKVVVGP